MMMTTTTHVVVLVVVVVVGEGDPVAGQRKLAAPTTKPTGNLAA